MNYSSIYDQLILDRRSNPPSAEEYVEVHHIVPRHVGGSDDPSNLIRLRPEDHFFAHLLLAKANGGVFWAAVRIMAYASHNAEDSPVGRFCHYRDRYARGARMANASMRGVNHPSADLLEYLFENVSREIFTGNRHDFAKKFSIDVKGVNNVLAGYAKTVEGWFLPAILSEDDLFLLRSGMKTTNDTEVHTLHNASGEVFSGTRIAIWRRLKLSRSMVNSLVIGARLSAGGWYVRKHNPAGLVGTQFTSGDKNGAADKSVYNFSHVDGLRFTGTRMQLVGAHGICRFALSQMMRGRAETSFGWSVDRSSAANDNTTARDQKAVA